MCLGIRGVGLAYLSGVRVNPVQAQGEQSVFGPDIKPLVALVQQHGLGLKRHSMSLEHPRPVQLPELCTQQARTSTK